MEGFAEQQIILLKLLNVLNELPLFLPSGSVQSPLALLDMSIQHRMRSQDSIDIIPQKHSIRAVFFDLLEELQCNLTIELCLVYIGLDYLVQRVVQLVLVQPRGLPVTDSRELVGDPPVVRHQRAFK